MHLWHPNTELMIKLQSQKISRDRDPSPPQPLLALRGSRGSGWLIDQHPSRDRQFGFLQDSNVRGNRSLDLSSTRLFPAETLAFASTQAETLRSFESVPALPVRATMQATTSAPSQLHPREASPDESSVECSFISSYGDGSWLSDQTQLVEAILMKEEELLAEVAAAAATEEGKQGPLGRRKSGLPGQAAPFAGLKAIIAETMCNDLGVAAERGGAGYEAKPNGSVPGGAGSRGGFEASVSRVVSLVSSLPDLVEAHAEKLVIASSWGECLGLLMGEKATLTAGSKFLLACACEAVGAGAKVGKSLVEVGPLSRPLPGFG